MHNTAIDVPEHSISGEFDYDDAECDVIELRPAIFERDSLPENLINELDAWASHALASNGFGDY
ncbi:MAG: hypothetical protein GY785_00750 [Gammaproteobacteria bacterium]|nr:hypothetical protein [Gammaproteobacteria bacterium]MCP4981846.1 hypothetical protein [Gammaproteobacteria bacterium]